MDGTKKLLLVAGARPQFIKAAPVIKALRSKACFQIVLVHTGQHYDYNLSEIFFEELDLPKPDHNLDIGSTSQALQIGRILLKLSPVLEVERPDMVLVFGDTNSTSAAALCAAAHQIPIAHIEAGLREFDKTIPEEINKLVTDAIATLYFCPTTTGVSNLRSSGISRYVHLTGDVGLDIIFQNPERIEQADRIFKELGLTDRQYYFATCHRAANTDKYENLENILSSFNQMDHPVILPLHPRTAKAIEQYKLGHLINNNRCITLNPVGFWETQFLIKHAKMVFTDSGGIIKESYFHSVPSVITDKQTEWIEIIEEGWSIIAGPETGKILELMHNFRIPHEHKQSLGDGRASEKIAELIYEYLQYKK